MGVSGGAARDLGEEGYDGRDVCYVSERGHYRFWSEHAKVELRTRKTHKILRFLSLCWEKNYMDNRFYAGNTIFEAFVQDYSRISINLLLALYLVYPRCLFIMGLS